MAKRPVYQDSDGLVINVIVAEDGFNPGAGLVLGVEGGEIGDTWNGSAYVNPGPPFDAAAEKINLISQVWSQAELLQDTLTVTVNTHAYGCDPFSQSSMNAFATAIANNVAPDPILFTPKGELDGVSHTSAEFITVAEAVMNKVDSIIKSYLAHKKAIINLANEEATITAYDVTTGWPT